MAKGQLFWGIFTCALNSNGGGRGEILGWRREWTIYWKGAQCQARQGIRLTPGQSVKRDRSPAKAPEESPLLCDLQKSLLEEKRRMFAMQTPDACSIISLNLLTLWYTYHTPNHVSVLLLLLRTFLKIKCGQFFFKSLLNLLQYCFCFMFWFFGH